MATKPFLSTDDLLAMLAQAPKPRIKSFLRVGVMAVGMLSVPALLCISLFVPDSSPRKQAPARAAARQPFDADKTTAVSVRLDSPASIFVDGRHIAMRSRCDLSLTRGQHVIVVHLRDETVRRTVDVGDRPLRVVLDRHAHRLKVEEQAHTPVQHR